MVIEFEWDEKKNLINQAKHGVSFETAALVFNDPKRCEVYDYNHSFTEDRWKVIGIAGFSVVTVITTNRNGKNRFISARNADNDEEKEYFYGYSKKDN